MPQEPTPARRFRQDLTGKRFGKLVVLGKSDRTDNGRNFPFWHVLCDCGTEKDVDGAALKGGLTKTCGCGRAANFRKDGLATKHRREYAVWQAMIQRCHNPKAQRWNCYGARGIAVCDRWRSSFAAFFEDVGPRPSDEHSIERKENDGPYEPGNAVWATAAEQNRNKRTNHFIEHDGRNLTVTEWSRETGLSADLIARRHELGWPTEDIFGVPVGEFARTRPRDDRGRYIHIKEESPSHA